MMPRLLPLLPRHSIVHCYNSADRVPTFVIASRHLAAWQTRAPIQISPYPLVCRSAKRRFAMKKGSGKLILCVHCYNNMCADKPPAQAAIA